MPGSRIKVINDIGELVSVFYSCNTEVKKKVFQETSKKWCTIEEIKEKYGDEGVSALKYLEKIKFVETQWITTDSGVVRAYHAFYDMFHITLSMPIMEASEVLRVINMSDEEFKEWENRILEIIKSGNTFIGYIVEKLGVSQIMLRSLIKRSEKLDIKGMQVEVL
ncbi:MAG: ArsR family transcriptional regulator [Euryarchaeota archaeon]|nr:ArsR family transcriptional regulator [Euryarchaeota archaeon]